MADRRRRLLVLMAQLAVLVAAYFVTARLGLLLDAVSGFASLVWAPTGIALTSLLLFGYRLSPGIALGAFLANVSAGAPVISAFGISIGNTLEALAGAYLLRRLEFNLALSRVRDVLALILGAALASTTLSATIGVMSLWIGDVIRDTAMGATWRAWWVGDALGTLVVAPLLLIWSRLRPPLGAPRLVEGIALLVALAGASWMVFFDLAPGEEGGLLRQAYLTFPFLIWAALRFRQHGAVTGVFLVSVIAIAGTVLEHGPFVTGSLSQSLLLLQTFMGIASVTVLVLSATAVERDRAQDIAESSGKGAEAREAELRLVTDALPVLISFVDSGQHYRFNNRAYEDWFGAPREEIQGRHLREVLGPAAYDTVLPHVQTVLRGEQVHFESLLHYRDSNSRYVRSTYVPQVQAGGAVSGFVALVEDITARKEAEELLKASERKFATMFEGASFAMCLAKMPDVVIADVNPAFEGLIESPRQELLGKTLLDVALYEDRDGSTRMLELLRREGHVRNVELRIRTKTGRVRVIAHSLNLVDLGNEPYALVTLQDTTDQRRAEEAVRKSEERLRFRADTMASLYTLTAALSRTQTTEEIASLAIGRAYETLGASVSVAYLLSEGDTALTLLAQRGVDAALTPEFARLPLDAPLPVATAVRTGEPVWIESWEKLTELYPSVRDAKTSPTLLRAVAALPLTGKERMLGGIAFTFSAEREFTVDDKAFLTALAQQFSVAIERVRLYQSERTATLRLRVLTEASKALFEAKLDLREVLSTICQEVATRLGDSCTINLIRDESKVLELAATFHVRPEVLQSIQNTLTIAPVPVGEGLLGGVAAHGRPARIPVIPFEQFIAASKPEYRAHHEKYPITSLLVVPLRVSDRIIGTLTAARDRGNPAYTVEDQMLLQDIADRAALAVENARLFKQAQEAIQARDEFLSVASHELRTPLTSLELHVETLRRAARKTDHPLAPEAVDSKLEVIERQLDRLTGLIGDLLDVSRAVAGRFALELEPVDLSVVVAEATARLQEQARRAGCELVLRTSPCPGQWDKLRLDQIVTNLVSNAIKFGRGRPVEIEVIPEQDKGILRVRDQGIGIKPEDQARIFERFERAVSKRHFGGLGLGLWIVRQIVEALGGTISVQSEPNHGSQFVVTLSRELAQQVGAPTVEPSAVH